MQKQIYLEKGRINLTIDEDEYVCIRTIKEQFTLNGMLYKEYTLSQWDDYGFIAYTEDNQSKELSFEFDINHPLYFPLMHLLNGDETLIIDDDHTPKLKQKYMKVFKNDDNIIISFINKVNEEIKYKEFNVFVKNIMFDLRSKIDCQKLDTKERLHIFFNEAVNVLGEEYHQMTLEECSIRQKILKKKNN